MNYLFYNVQADSYLNLAISKGSLQGKTICLSYSVDVRSESTFCVM